MHWLILLFAFLLTYSLVPLFRRYAIGHDLIDIPNQRSSHLIQTPRGGGLVFVIVSVATLLLSVYLEPIIPAKFITMLLAPAVALAALGYLDDRYSLSARLRLVIQVLASAIFLTMCLHLPQTFSAVFMFGLALFLIVWSTNLFNFMDGTDGYSATEALFVLVPASCFLYASGYSELTWFIAIITATVSGFLLWNWPTAKIFMGDVGSLFLGFMIGALAIHTAHHQQLSPIIWFILYGVFWFDATVTLLRRWRAGEALFQAHKSHAYQRIHQAGFTHQKLLKYKLMLNAILVLHAYWAFHFPYDKWLAFTMSVMFLGLFYWGVERVRPMYPKQTQVVSS